MIICHCESEGSRELPVEDDPAMGIIGLGKSGKDDISESHDVYLAMLLNKKKQRNVEEIY